MPQDKNERFPLWDWVKAISTLTIVNVISYKIYLTNINLTVDFPTLLSLILALFSVALSALFYFKATETSNTFYDNTYTFTKDIAQLLVKIESGFGERLKNLDEGYTSMRDYLQHSNDAPNDKVQETKQKIKDEQEEMKKVISERNKIVEELVEKSNLHQEEKESVLKQLHVKEKELTEAQQEISKMNKRLFMERMERKQLKKIELSKYDNGFLDFTYKRVVKKIGEERIIQAPRDYVIKKFNQISDNLPDGYIQDLEAESLYDNNGLNSKGYEFIVQVARKHKV